MESTSDERTVNNAVRHQYRVLTEEEKAQVSKLKDMGQAFIEACEEIRGQPAAANSNRREFALAITKTEEAVMWAVRGVTK
jgi:hypothetical protein